MSEFGRNFDRAQARWDSMSPPEDPLPVENECKKCGELFEDDEQKDHCPKCQKEIDNE